MSADSAHAAPGEQAAAASAPGRARLPGLVVIGAMKCGTTALHRYLDAHPDIAMAPAKELNFFVGPASRPAGDESASWHVGNWHRGLEWYASQFPPARVRGEASPGYTSPAHPEAPARMARVLPDVRLTYLVRDPIDRALSQYRHHVAEGGERRPLAKALLDPGSQYLSRSRYVARLRPYLEAFPREAIHICLQEDLLLRRRLTLARLYAFAGADESFWSDALAQRWHVGAERQPALSRALERHLAELLSDDVAALRELTGRALSAWRAY